MRSDERDDHIPAPPEERSAPKASARRQRRPGSAARGRWGDRLLFLAVGALLGFAGAWLGLEKHGSPPAATVDPHADPHAGVPGFDGGQGSPAADQEARKRLVQLQQAAIATPESYDILVQLGNAAYDANDPKQAVEAYEKALALKDGDPNVMTDLGVSYRNLGNVDRALALFDRALAASPDHWQAKYNKVVVYAFDKKDKAKAAALLAELRKEHPDIPALEALSKEMGSGG